MQDIAQEKSPIKSRILDFLRVKGISQYEFYQKTGITRGVLGQKNGISEENLLRCLDYYKEVSPEWLLTGEGEMLKFHAKTSDGADVSMESGDGIKERIKQYCRNQGISIANFERSIYVSNGYVNSISKGIGQDKLNAILEKYPEINLEWLLTGEGEMLKSCGKTTNAALDTISHTVPVAQHCSAGNGIPLIPVEAMAGFAKENPPVLEYECERYVVPMFRDAEFLIPVKGSSMIPKYNSGDIVACKMLPLSDLFFQWNKVYVLDTVQGALIKRVKAGHDKEHLLIISDNERYEPFELHVSQIRAVALVIGVIRLE